MVRPVRPAPGVFARRTRPPFNAQEIHENLGDSFPKSDLGAGSPGFWVTRSGGCRGNRAQTIGAGRAQGCGRARGARTPSIAQEIHENLGDFLPKSDLGAGSPRFWVTRSGDRGGNRGAGC
ncbi:hypothetical protein GCM10009805_05820 [Leucobacter chromiireducens subsp. solipictus]